MTSLLTIVAVPYVLGIHCKGVITNILHGPEIKTNVVVVVLLSKAPLPFDVSRVFDVDVI